VAKINYAFVGFGEPKYYIDDYKGINPFKDKENKDKIYKGYIDIVITCVDNLYIGSGFSKLNNNNNNQLYNETIKHGNEYIISGSSFKGAIRNIASAVSEACLPKLDKEEKNKVTILEENIDCKVRFDRNAKEYKKKLCIVCDMFGAMGYASKIIIPDFKVKTADTEGLELNVQHGPEINDKYKNKDGSSKGYKFYKTYCEKYDDTSQVRVNTVKKGSEFSGRIYFSNITEYQLSLLLFSMGIDESFDIKLGGYKNDGLGHVKIKIVDSEINVDKTPLELAREYPVNTGIRKGQIAKLREILKP